MTLQMNGISEYDPEKGIPLAIDPNLIDIPSITAPLGANGIVHDDTASKDSDSTSVEDQTSKKSQRSLIQNPYELFGQMSLEQFIPLMLKQRGPGTKFADIHEDVLQQEIEQEQNQEQMSSEDKSVQLGEVTVDGLEQNTSGMEQEQNVKKKDGDGDIEMTDSVTHPEKPEVSNEIPDDHLNTIPNSDETISHEEFINIKKSVLEHVTMALNESSLSLEFISLLLSSTRTSAGISSMSPYLKKIAPPASLNADKVPLEMLNEHDKLIYDITQKGWNLRSLEDCKRLLKQHYQILLKSVESESTYWNQISDNISNKDVLFKMKDRNTGRRTLGIKYGFDDSGSSYTADKGIALLRATSEGSELELVPVLDSEANMGITKSSPEQFVRVRIFTKIEQEDDYLLSGQSSLNEILLNNNKDIKSQIARLRFFIFEKELMHHLKVEAGQLLPYGVSVENENKVVLELPNEKIEFELVNLDEEVISNYQQEAAKINNKRANLILVMLNMLQVVMYKKQLWKRMNPSPNASKGHITYGKDLVLLRAILGKIRHKRYKQLIEKIIHNTILNKKEGLMMTVKEDIISNDNEFSKNKELATLQREIALFDKVLSMPRTDFTITIPEKGKVDLSLRSTNHCNAVVFMKYVNEEEVVKFDTKFSEFTEFEEFMNFVYNEFFI